ncbi:MAG: metal ABC transporter permease [Alphaproteobacteria bacterium]|nr:metal ABC transporter permease [Alphaproteobacteria bacterium]
MLMLDDLIVPFSEFAFMRRALVACIALSLGAGPIGVFLILRRMSLMGDALAHAVLPGAAIGYAIGGLSLAAMGIGGLIAGLAVALLSGFAARTAAIREDASFACFYLISLALGVLIVSVRGGGVDLMHMLFGSVLAVDQTALRLIAAIASASVLGLAILWRGLVAESVDPSFLRVAGVGAAIHAAFLALVVLNLVAGFQTLGTLLAIAMMILPAAAARFWAIEIWSVCAIAILVASLSSYGGLLLSYHAHLPSGPAIVLFAGTIYAFSLIFGRHGSVASRRFHGLHHQATGHPT